MTITDCPCGSAHEVGERVVNAIATIIQRQGPLISIQTPVGTWKVSRLYVALHGIKADDIPALAATYHWETA